jgi:hypothetical protein
MPCSFGKMPCLAPLLQRHRPHSARACAALPRPLVRHARCAVGCVAARDDEHGAAHAGDDVRAFGSSESQPISCVHKNVIVTPGAALS